MICNLLSTLLRCSLVFLLLAVVACQQSTSNHPALKQAEQLMNTRPDSALLLLEQTNPASLSSHAYADWCLLITQARDKNYIIHTSDSLIHSAVDYYTKHNNPQRLMMAYHYMACVSHDMHNAVRAQEYYLKALKAGKEVHDPPLKARICSNLGMLYTSQQLFETALPYMQEALGYLKEMGDTTSQAVVLRDIGRTFDSLKELDSAQVYYERALVHADQVNKTAVLSELGGVLLDKKEYNTAISKLKEALASAKEDNQYYTIYYITGKYYLDTNQLDSAQYYLQKGLFSASIATKAGAYYHLSQIARKRQDLHTYAELRDQFDLYRDTADQRLRTENLQRIQAMYDYQKVEKEAQAYKLQNAKNQNWFYLAFIGFLLVSFGLIGYGMYYRNRKNLWEIRLKWHQDFYLLQTQKGEVAKQGQELREKTLRKSDIYRKFHENSEWIPKEADWEAFFAVMDTAYPDFAANVEKYRPGQKETEKHLFYLTKANVNLHTITQRMNREPSTITKRRKRIYEAIFGEGTAENFDLFVRSL